MFKASKSLKAVTIKLEIKNINKVCNYIDTPGFSDPDKDRSDDKNFKLIIDNILNRVVEFGLASIV